ncbi:MAG: type III-B CRISPR module RAMP protein Cmr6 [Planctomycetaceae bacterium]|nr:type III-B CRISPR module RAMP protein Cmr6 [Planctomycetaceae bacterium]
MREPIIDLAAKRNRGQHPGLLLQRWLAVQPPPPGDTSPGARQQKEAAIADRQALFEAAREAADDTSVQAVYKLAFERWEREFPHAPDADVPQRFDGLATEGRMVIGLGAENVLETGLRLHHTYGLPVIPGSALKGLANHYCDHVWGQKHLGEAAPNDNKSFRRDEAYHNLLFGFSRDAKADAGAIVFHDAWITPDSVQGCLCQDVMTPHHPKWQNNEAAPTDFDSPVPVSFLSVTGRFRVGVSWAGPAAHPQAKNWTELTFNLLKESLKEWGIGGKTSSGYGRLVVPPPPPPPPAPKLYDKATVTVLERRDVSGKATFKVQEVGRPKPGWLQYGTPPATLPNIGDTIQVYWNNNELNNPQYRWDASPPPPPPRPGNRPRR